MAHVEPSDAREEQQRQSDQFIRGYETAMAEFETQRNPRYINPYPEGSDGHRGYEEAVYDLTQK